MKIMAVDYGDARTGVAFSDPTASIVGESFVIKQWNADVLAQQLCDEAEARQVKTIVLGYPLNMDGSKGVRAEKSEALAKKLMELGNFEIVMQDERWTTVDAHKILFDNGKNAKKRKNTVDAVAAALILETYLGSLK